MVCLIQDVCALYHFLCFIYSIIFLLYLTSLFPALSSFMLCYQLPEQDVCTCSDCIGLTKVMILAI